MNYLTNKIKLIRGHIKKKDSYIRKRIIQGHKPYISSRIRKIKDLRITESGNKIRNVVLFGNLNVGIVKKARKENLDYVLKESKENLLPYLKGRIIITSDHGEAVGEKGIYFQPEPIYIKELIERPWLIINKTRKKKIILKNKETKKIREIVMNLEI